MKTAHKQILALLALALLLSLCACAQKTQPESDEPKMSTDKVDFPTKADKKRRRNSRKKRYRRAI